MELVYVAWLIKVTTSPSSGKRPFALLEKIRFPSSMISNTPPPLEIKFVFTSGNVLFNSASKLEALGK